MSGLEGLTLQRTYVSGLEGLILKMWLALKVNTADVYGPEGLLSVGGHLDFVHEDPVNLLVPVNV